MAKFYELNSVDGTTLILNLEKILAVIPKEDGTILVLGSDMEVKVTHQSLMMAFDHADVPYMLISEPEASEGTPLSEVDDSDIKDESGEIVAETAE